MSLTFGLSPWLLVLCALGAAALTYWSYRRTTPPLSRGRRLLLGGLRFLALFLVLFLLFQPVLRRVLRTEEPPVLAVLIDNSRSLRLTTGDSLAPRRAVEAALRRLDVPDDGITHRFAFGQTLHLLPEDPTAALDSLRFNASRTDIATALATVRERLQRENLRAIVLLSDGQYNTGRNPLYVAERLGVPVHTVALGDTSRRRDVLVQRVTTNDLAYAGTAVPVQVGVRTQGFGGATVQVVLVQNGERLDTQQVKLPEEMAEVPVDLQFTPETAGLQRFVVGVSRLDGEATYRNNTQAFSVRVLESKRRILLLAGAPSPDVGALRQLLQHLPNVELTTRIARGDGAFYEGPLPDSLAAFDVLLLAGFPGPTATPSTIGEVVQAAERDAALLFFLDSQTDLAALREHFAGVLPVVPEAVRPSYVEAQFVPTPRAFRHPLFAASETTDAWWQTLPPLSINQSRWQASPDAEVLAHPEVRGVSLEAPLLVTRSRSGQRTAALLGTGIWRWSNVPDDLTAASRHWQTFFSDLLHWVSAPEMQRPVRVRPARETFAAGEPVRLTGQVYDESLTPVTDASVEVTITRLDTSGTRTPYQMESLGNGRYALTLGTLPEGTYRYRAEARREGTSLGTDRGTFAVGPLTLEYRETRADAVLLRQIAQRSGGTSYTVQDLEALPARLARSGVFTPLVVEREREIPLWHRYSLLIAVIALLAAEWALRKRSGMV